MPYGGRGLKSAAPWAQTHDSLPYGHPSRSLQIKDLYIHPEPHLLANIT